MQAYELILHERAWAVLAVAKSNEKQRLLTLLDSVKSTPFRTGDFQQRDETGRINEVLLLDDWLVTFWSDHASREVRVVNLERVED